MLGGAHRRTRRTLQGLEIGLEEQSSDGCALQKSIWGRSKDLPGKLHRKGHLSMPCSLLVGSQPAPLSDLGAICSKSLMKDSSRLESLDPLW